MALRPTTTNLLTSIFWYAIGFIPVIGPAINAYDSFQKKDYISAFTNTGHCIADILTWGYASKFVTLCKVLRYGCRLITTLQVLEAVRKYCLNNFSIKKKIK